MEESNKIVFSKNTKRIEFVDALRGFLMICVLMHHMSYFVLETGDYSFKYIWNQFQMPVFFFISGFVIYKHNEKWSIKKALDFCFRKILLLLSGTVAFCVAFGIYSKYDFYQVLTDHFKGGYWFTYVLAIFYIWYAVLSFVLHRFYSWVLFVVSILIYMGGGPKGILSLPIGEELKGILSMVQWRYFAFFLWGVLSRKHLVAFQHILDNRWIITVSIVLFVLINLFSEFHPENKIISRFYFLIRDTSASFLVFSFFYRNQAEVAKETICGRFLQYVGKRTLDIYYIHYFLIPFSLHGVFQSMYNPIDPVVELIISIFLSLFILAVSMVIGNLLRMSSTCEYWLFCSKSK